MKTITCLSVFLLALFVCNAQGQYIEIRYEVTAISDGSGGHIRSGRSVLVFDTSVAPEGSSGRQVYHAISGHYYVGIYLGTPFDVLDEEVDVFKSAELIYSPVHQLISIETRDTLGHRSTVIIEGVSESFFEGMESLPDAPESYSLGDDTESQYILARVANKVCEWSPEAGFYGGSVTYGARLVTELEPEACSPADINRDGIVDFFDVSQFIQIFLAGCP